MTPARLPVGPRWRWAPVLLTALLLAGCDATAPRTDVLVVEAFPETGRPLPPILVSRTSALDGPDEGRGVADAAVQVWVDGRAIAYVADAARPGRYVPAGSEVLGPGARFAVEVQAGTDVATAATVLPPAVALTDVDAEVGAPVEAVIIGLSGTVREGHAYPITVRLAWDAAAAADSLRWVRLQLSPRTDAPGNVLDLLQQLGEVTHEDSLHVAGGATGARAWTGSYAMPQQFGAYEEHATRVAILRGGADYARYARSRDTPGTREPIGNVVGGLGIVAGVSLDTLTIVLSP